MPTERELKLFMTTVPAPAQSGGFGTAVAICTGWGDV